MVFPAFALVLGEHTRDTVFGRGTPAPTDTQHDCPLLAKAWHCDAWATGSQENCFRLTRQTSGGQLVAARQPRAVGDTHKTDPGWQPLSAARAKGPD
jgi:hypothetical protein